MKKVIRYITVSLGFFYGLFIFLLINIIQILALPLRFINLKAYRFIDGCAFQWGATCGVLLCHHLRGGLPIYFYGDVDKIKKRNLPQRALLISNHISSTDWLVNVFLTTLLGHGYNIRFFLKTMHGYVPLIGWAAWLHGMIFLERDMNKDEETIRRNLKSYRENDDGLWLLLYPEGTFVTPACKDILEKSHAYSKKHGLTVYYNVLQPRTGAWEICMEEENRKCFDAVIDYTLVIDPVRCHIGEQYPITLPDIPGRDDKKKVQIHCLLRTYDINDIPLNKNECNKWLQKLFDEKEKNLEYFIENGTFPAEKYRMPFTMKDYFMGILSLIAWTIAQYLVWKFIHPLVLLASWVVVTGSSYLIYKYEVAHQLSATQSALFANELKKRKLKHNAKQ